MRLVQPPRLWPADPHHHRRATWMELFFDLIFVAAIAEASAPLHSEYSVTGVARLAFMFILIWWAWTSHTFFYTRFDTDDVIQRTLILVQSFIVAVMAANARDALDSISSAGFGAAYAVMRFVLAVQYLRASRIAEVRQLTRRHAGGITTAALLWIASASVDVPLRYWLWSAAFVVDLITPWLAGRHLMKFPPDATHLPERFGLFTIILLGEFVTSVMHGIESQEEWSFGAASTALMSMAVGFALWWWYFDGAGAASERRIRNTGDARRFHVRNYAHFPLIVGVGVTGAGLRHLISLESGEHPHAPEAWILTSAVAMVMFALIVAGTTSVNSIRRYGHGQRIGRQCFVACLALASGAVGPMLHRSAFTAILLALTIMQVLLASQQLHVSHSVRREAA
jgi:low temperature requirement protein LtrA